MELCSRIVSQVRLGHVQWGVRASWARLQGPQILLESESPWGALCSFPQDLQKRPCHHSSLLQMRKLSTNSKQVKCNALCLLLLPRQPVCGDMETQPGTAALAFHCIPGAFPYGAHELLQVAWQTALSSIFLCRNTTAQLSKFIFPSTDKDRYSGTEMQDRRSRWNRDPRLLREVPVGPCLSPWLCFAPALPCSAPQWLQPSGHFLANCFLINESSPYAGLTSLWDGEPHPFPHPICLDWWLFEAIPYLEWIMSRYIAVINVVPMMMISSRVFTLKHSFFGSESQTSSIATL